MLSSLKNGVIFIGAPFSALDMALVVSVESWLIISICCTKGMSTSVCESNLSIIRWQLRNFCKSPTAVVVLPGTFGSYTTGPEHARSGSIDVPEDSPRGSDTCPESVWQIMSERAVGAGIRSKLAISTVVYKPSLFVCRSRISRHRGFIPKYSHPGATGRGMSHVRPLNKIRESSDSEK